MTVRRNVDQLLAARLASGQTIKAAAAIAAAIAAAYRHVVASTPEPAQPTVDVSAVTELIARLNVAQETRADN